MPALIKCTVTNCTICQNRELICPDCGAHFPAATGLTDCAAFDCVEIKGQQTERCICGALSSVHVLGKFAPTNCEKFELNLEADDHFP